MKQISKTIKCSFALALVVMLLLSMMSGVLTLSASADDSTLPVLVNKPVLTHFKDNDSDDSLHTGYNSLVLNFDNSKCEGTGNDLSDIISINYDVEYSDGYGARGTWYEQGYGLSEYNSTYYQNGYVYSYDYTRNNWSSYSHSSGMNGSNAFHVIDAFSTVMINPRMNAYTDYINRDQVMTSLDLTINYANGESQPISVIIAPMNDYIKYKAPVVTCTCMALSLAHSTTIDDEDFYKLETAIFGVEGQYDDTTNRYYVNIESENDVVLPMDHMSSTAYLVQTRVGENVVYNTPQSVDFGENSISPYPEGADYGRVFTLPDGSYASEEDIHNVYPYLYNNGIQLYNYNGRIYNGSSSSTMNSYIANYPGYLKNGNYDYPDTADFLDNGYILGVEDLYTGIPGTNFDQEKINSSLAALSGKYNNSNYWDMPHNSYAEVYCQPRMANIRFNANSTVTGMELINALEEFMQDSNTSSAAKNILNRSNRCYTNFGISYKSGSNKSYRYSLSEAKDYLSGRYSWYGTYDTLTYIQLYSDNRDSNDYYYMTDEQRNGFIEIVNFLIGRFGEDVLDLEKTFIPKYTSLSNYTWTPVWDYLTSKGMTEI